MATRKFSKSFIQAARGCGKQPDSLLRWLKRRGYANELYQTDDGYDVPEHIKEEFIDRFFDDGEPDENWVTGSELSKSLNLDAGNFSRWIRRYPKKLKRLRPFKGKEKPRLIPPSLQAEYLNARGVRKVANFPLKDSYTSLKSLPFPSAFFYARKHLIGEVISYRSRVYLRKEDANWLIRLYKDLSVPPCGYIKISDFAKQQDISLSGLRQWAYSYGHKFKQYIVGAGGRCAYISPRQQKEFRARRKCKSRKEKND